MIEIAGRVDESSHLLRAEHGRQSLAGFGKRNVLRQKIPAQCLYEPEAQRGHILTDRGRSQLLRLKQMGLILPDLLGPELVRWLVKIRRELADDSDVDFCGTMGVITALEFLPASFGVVGSQGPPFLRPNLLQSLTNCRSSNTR